MEAFAALPKNLIPTVVNANSPYLGDPGLRDLSMDQATVQQHSQLSGRQPDCHPDTGCADPGNSGCFVNVPPLSMK